MNISNIIYFFIVALLGLNCKSTQLNNKTIVEGELLGFNGEVIVVRLLNFNQGTKEHIDSVVIKNDKFVFEFMNENIKCIDFVIKDYDIVSKIVFVEKGKVSIKGSKDSLINQFSENVLDLKVNGSITQQECNLFEKKRNNSQVKEVYVDFIKNNPNSYLSAVFILTTPGSNYLYKNLTTKVKESSYGVQIKDNIERSDKIALGKKAPNFSGINHKGIKVSLDSFKGFYTIIEFWASWCGPCRASHPKLRKLINRNSKNDIRIISLSIDNVKSRSQWLDAIKKDSVDLWDQCISFEMDNDPKYNYFVKYIPRYIIVDRNGIILKDYDNTDSLINYIDLIEQ